MTHAFRTLIKDDEKRRVVIDREAWEAEGIEKGDFVEITVRKLKVE